jgi:hypothetical protein
VLVGLAVEVAAARPARTVVAAQAVVGAQESDRCLMLPMLVQQKLSPLRRLALVGPLVQPVMGGMARMAATLHSARCLLDTAAAVVQEEVPAIQEMAEEAAVLLVRRRWALLESLPRPTLQPSRT